MSEGLLSRIEDVKHPRTTMDDLKRTREPYRHGTISQNVRNCFARSALTTQLELRMETRRRRCSHLRLGPFEGGDGRGGRASIVRLLPAGTVKVATGANYMRTRFTRLQ